MFMYIPILPTKAHKTHWLQLQDGLGRPIRRLGRHRPERYVPLYAVLLTTMHKKVISTTQTPNSYAEPHTCTQIVSTEKAVIQ